jgi:methylenetetrahydrofolate dehydrogenase (NADP+)/methenyltetrahydrofolate cyclohydrolase
MDGKALATTIKERVAECIKRDLNRAPQLLIITIGDDDASKVYVKNKFKAAEEVGIRAHHCIISKEAYNQPNFKVNLIDAINAHDGVILQLPVPYWCNAKEILEMIPAEKDVDGLTAEQVGLLRTAPLEALSPCTPAGIMELILEYYHPFDKEDGKNNALVIGRSNLVGRPIAEMLLQDDWTVTIAHSKTPKEKSINFF